VNVDNNISTVERTKFSFPVMENIPLLIGLVIGLFFSIIGFGGVIKTLVIPILIGFAFIIVAKPARILILIIYLSFFISGLSRYLPLPWGLGIDILLVLCWLVMFIKEFKNLKLVYLKNDFMVLSMLWMFYLVFLITNPESKSTEAWFYAMRGIGFYHVLILSLTLLLFRDVKYLDKFLNTIIGLSVLGALWGMKQKYIVLDDVENHWLWVDGHFDEHILFGVLRAFSFYSDAGQFGASQAMIAMMCCILFLQKNISLKLRIFYAIGFLFTFIGFGISGARGALAIPAIGGFVFLILSKNIKLLTLGLIAFGITFYILKYTHVGHGVEQVRRMRTALASDNPSLNARKRNQDIFGEYLKDKPLGGGVGSAGYWGNRFSPNTLLAQTPTDSYYVKIWVETGVIRVCFHVFILGYIMGRAVSFINHLKSDNLKIKAIAIFSSIIGVLAASYGNQVFSQMPTGVIMSISIGLLFLMPHFDQQLKIVK